MSKAGTYWYKGGYNAKAVAVTVISAAVAVFPVLFGDLPGIATAAQYSWFVGYGLSFVALLGRHAQRPGSGGQHR